MREETTLEEAKDELRKSLETGARCPCCNQFAKMYKRVLSSHMLVSLIGLYRCDEKAPDEWFHISKFIPKGQRTAGDYAFLRYWGFIIKQEINDDETKRYSGLWRITDTGRMFVRGEIKVQSHIRTYDSKMFGFAGEPKDIHECLGTKFSYKEMMEGTV
jgi:hypothetical protein